MIGLALVLGPVLEAQARRATSITEGVVSLLLRQTPLTLGVFLVALVVAVLPYASTADVD